MLPLQDDSQWEWQWKTGGIVEAPRCQGGTFQQGGSGNGTLWNGCQANRTQGGGTGADDPFGSKAILPPWAFALPVFPFSLST